MSNRTSAISHKSESDEHQENDLNSPWDFEDPGHVPIAPPPPVLFAGTDSDIGSKNNRNSALSKTHERIMSNSGTGPHLLRNSTSSINFNVPSTAIQRQSFRHSASSSSLNANALTPSMSNSSLFSSVGGPRPMGARKFSASSAAAGSKDNLPTLPLNTSVDSSSEERRVNIFNRNKAPPSKREKSLRRRHNEIFGTAVPQPARPQNPNDFFGGMFNHGDAEDSGSNVIVRAYSHLKNNWWSISAKSVTCCIPGVLLKKLGKMEDAKVQQAWREKVTLCVIAVCMWAGLAFLTFAFTMTVCPINSNNNQYDISEISSNQQSNQLVIVNGNVYNMGNYLSNHNSAVSGSQMSGMASSIQSAIQANYGSDFSAYFPSTNLGSSACTAVSVDGNSLNLPCQDSSIGSFTFCHNTGDASFNSQLSSMYMGEVIFGWSDVQLNPTKYIVYNGKAIRVDRFLGNQSVLNDQAEDLLKSALGRDATLLFISSGLGRSLGECLSSVAVAGTAEKRSVGCFASDIFLYVSFTIIVGVVVIRFVLAMVFYWTMSKKLGSLKFKASKNGRFKRREFKNRSLTSSMTENSTYFTTETSTTATPIWNPAAHESLSESVISSSSTAVDSSPEFHARDQQFETPAYGMSRTTSHNALQDLTSRTAVQPADVSKELESLSHVLEEPYTIIMVPCYSEGQEALKTTLDSLARTTYSDDKKLIAVVADGIVKGSENPRSTPEILIDMIKLDKALPQVPAKLSYVAIASGSKKHNMAQIYVGHYVCGSRKVPTILIIKCGTPEEASQAKPGNRGKRDSQLILMAFFQKIIFDERLSPLEYDLFTKVRYLMGVHADEFEVCLMVDADTVVAPDSLSRMVACMVNDPQVIGLCGETRISNKRSSFTTRIQVFEYYINHHLNKAFESIFGGVTCLPGCFCMYRIKTPKEDGFWVPILASPDIVAPYSADQVDTLHQKNLLLLGEDRFLTTLMLKTFPRRKLLFVPRAFCKTQVPDSFKVLLSQRRRWINSTVHNLLELVLVRELCGTFCFSMQFVLLLELIGSATLPAAICFTILLIILSIVKPPVQILALVLLFVILGLPAFLILLTTRKFVYIYWMLIYLVGLPIWNFVLPVYSFWHFDDFSWGQTRKVAGEKNGGDKYGHGSHDIKESELQQIPHKRWAAWEFERRRKIYDAFTGNTQNNSDLSHDKRLSSSSGSQMTVDIFGETNKRHSTLSLDNAVKVQAELEARNTKQLPSVPANDQLESGKTETEKLELALQKGPELPETSNDTTMLPEPLGKDAQFTHSETESLLNSIMSIISKDSSPELQKLTENSKDERL